MDYEKKYKNALEWARQVMNGETGFIRKEVEEIFPELKSKDERIRKVIIEHFEGSHDCMYPYKGFTKEQIIAWLKKHDEKKIYKFKGGILHKWLTPEQVLRVMEIERKELVDKAWEWVEDNILSINQQDKSRLYYEQFVNYIEE